MTTTSGAASASLERAVAPAARPLRVVEGGVPATPEPPLRTRHRRDGPATSRQGAADVVPRAGTQRGRLLLEYARAGDGGLTDEQAGERSGLAAVRSCCYWKRCGELRDGGYLEATDETRTSSAGSEQRVSRITAAGRALVGEWSQTAASG